MATIESPTRLLDEVAELLAGRPGPEELLSFHPSAAAQQRVRHLLDKQQDETLSADEERELEQYENIELLMRLVKAKLRSATEPS